MLKIFEKQPAAPSFSGWYGATIIRTPVYCVLPSGKEVFILNKISNVVEHNKKNDPYIVMDIEKETANIEDYVKQLEDHDYKWFDRYRTKEVHGLGPLEFIDWVKSNGYEFDKDMTEIDIFTGQSIFHGNLDRLSCAFRYDIIDTELLQALCSFANEKGITINR